MSHFYQAALEIQTEQQKKSYFGGVQGNMPITQPNSNVALVESLLRPTKEDSSDLSVDLADENTQ